MRHALALVVLAAFGVNLITSASAQEEVRRDALQIVEPALPGTRPDSGAEADLDAMRANLFRGAYEPEVRLRAIEPGGWESVLGIRQTPSGYRLFRLEAKGNLWAYWVRERVRNGTPTEYYSTMTAEEAEDELAYLFRNLPDDYRDLEIERCAVELDARIAETLIDVWQVFLERANSDVIDIEGDAAIYRLEAEEKAGVAYISSSEASGIPYLMLVAHRMGVACESAEFFGGAAITNFSPELDDLLARMGR
jgi:hypothetical protein